MNNAKNAPLQWGGLLVSLAGLVYCLTALTERGSQALCITSGCNLFKQVTIFGFSPWWFGAGAFLLIALLSLQSRRVLAFGAAMFFLALDTVFLGAMLFSAPCVSCLGAGLLFFLAVLALRVKPDFMHKTASPSRASGVVFFIWGVLFCANAATAFNELVPLKSLENPANSSFTVYFSPTCPACREAVLALGGKAAFYAVSKEAGDLLKIARLEDMLAEGMDLKTALPAMLAEAEGPGWLNYHISTKRALLLEWQLLRNKARLAHGGFTALPVVQSNGFPRALSGGSSARAGQPGQSGELQTPAHGGQSFPGASPGNPLSNILDGGIGQCIEGAQEPCD